MTTTIRSNKQLYKTELKTLIVLAIPTILEEILSTILQYVDTAMVGRLGENAIASVSLTTTISWLTGSIFSAFGIAIVALISSALGEKDYNKIKEVSKLAIFFTLITSSIVLLISLPIAPYIPRFMGAEKAIWDDAIAYFIIITIPMLFRAATRILGSAIRATKDTKTPMLINLSTNILNILLNYILIYKVGLGVRGAALGSAFSFALGGILMFIFFQRNETLKIKFSHFKLNKNVFNEGLSIALPSLGTSLVSCLGYVTFASLVSSMGTTIFASHSIACQAEEIVYIPGYGLRSATSVLVGIAAGEKNKQKFEIIVKESILITLLMMFISGIALYFLAFPFMKIFTSSENVISLGSKMLKLIAFSEPFFGLMIVSQGIFWGLGKTKYTFIIEAISMWGIRILLTFMVVKIWKGTLREVWYCMILDNLFKALALSLPIFIKKNKLNPIKSFDVNL